MDLGVYYGYPECCRYYFYHIRMKGIGFTLSQSQNKFTGNGFIPCPNCADYLVENNLKIVSLINNRLCPHSFPETYCSNIKCSCIKPKWLIELINYNSS